MLFNWMVHMILLLNHIDNIVKGISLLIYNEWFMDGYLILIGTLNLRSRIVRRGVNGLIQVIYLLVSNRISLLIVSYVVSCLNNRLLLHDGLSECGRKILKLCHHKIMNFGPIKNLICNINVDQRPIIQKALFQGVPSDFKVFIMNSVTFLLLSNLFIFKFGKFKVESNT